MSKNLTITKAIEKILKTQILKKLRCKICGHVRKNEPKTYPYRCANAKCGSSLWDVGLNVKCSVCNRLIFVPCVHHINGNHKDNHPKNRIVICRDCHTAIHIDFSQRWKGGHTRNRSYKTCGEDMFNKLNKLRNSLNNGKNSNLCES